MLFIGDLASPSAETSADLEKSFQKNRDLFSDKIIVANLEGLIYTKESIRTNEPILWNHPGAAEVLKKFGDPVFCLANNHILDLPHEFEPTVGLLKQHGIPYCGAGLSKEEASKPVVLKEKDREILLFSFCWDFLLYNQRNPDSGVYVAELRELELLTEIRKYKEINPEYLVVVYVHWNFDLETLPFPMHRSFSRALIDAGTSLVIGAHAHCVQGGEKYKEGYIVYGLGNFFIPDYQFVSGKLSYPEFANTELAIEWDPFANEVNCHWFKYEYVNGSHDLNYLSGERFEVSDKLLSFSPFTGMSDKEYLAYYRKNRRKKILIPVYTDHRKLLRNRIYTGILKTRASFARFLAKRGIIKWLN